MDLENIKKNLEIMKIKNLLVQTDYCSEKLNLYLDKINNKDDNTTENLTETFSQSEIYPSDISFLFKKPWNKLPIVHQIIKIKEFCKKICNSKAKQLNMEKNLINKLKNKQLLNSQIKYDEKMGKIIAIHNLNQLNMNI